MQGERRQAQDRNPALGAFLQRLRSLLGQLLAHDASEKGVRLLQRKAQVGATQFVEASFGSPPGQWQRRIEAGSQHQVQLGGQMPDQELEQAMHLAAMNALIIIQHQDHVFGHIRQIVDEQGRHAIGRGELRGLEEVGSGLAGVGEDPLQGSGEQVDEGGKLVVVGLEGEPGGRVVNCLQPLDQQGRLAKAGRGAHQSDGAAEPGVQALEEVSSGDDIATGAGSIELCVQERARRVGWDCGFVHWELGSSRLSRRHRDLFGGSVLSGEGLGSGQEQCQSERAGRSQPEVGALARARAGCFPVLGTGPAWALVRSK